MMRNEEEVGDEEEDEILSLLSPSWEKKSFLPVTRTQPIDVWAINRDEAA